jgi:glucokinase
MMTSNPIPVVAAIDVGETNQRVAIVKSDGRIIDRHAQPLASDPHTVLASLAQTARQLAEVHGQSIVGAGASLPAPIDLEMGRAIVLNPNARVRWDEVSVPDELSAMLGVPVALENDANAAALGEGWVGAAKGCSDYVFVAMGSAFGAGIMIDGRLHRGRHSMAGEISAFPMTGAQLRGEVPSSIALSAGGNAALREAQRILGQDATAADLFDAAYAGHRDATGWLHEAEEHIAMALAHIASLLDPEMIILGGGVVAAQGERFVQPIRSLVDRFAFGKPKITMSMLGADAQLVGAARIALLALGDQDIG